jgi:hypothetical protein
MARTQEQILQTITVAKDSVWVIEDAIEKLDGGETPSKDLKSNIDRNVGHLKLVVTDQEIVDSGEDISDLESAIITGEAKLAENIWLTNL